MMLKKLALKSSHHFTKILKKTNQFLRYTKFFHEKKLITDVKKTEIENITILSAFKDLEILDFQIEYISKFIDFKNIYLITPKVADVSTKFRNLMTVIEDREVVTENEKKQFFDKCSKSSRFPASWYYQQFLKLVHLKRIGIEDTFYIDADTIPLRPPEIFFNKLLVVPATDEYHYQYFDFIESYAFNINKNYRRNSHIPHFCYFQNSILMEIESLLGKNGLSLEKMVLNACTSNSYFSEFELYNQFLLNFHSDQCIEKHYNGINLARTEKNMKKSIKLGHFSFASFHHWKKEKVLPFF